MIDRSSTLLLIRGPGCSNVYRSLQDGSFTLLFRNIRRLGLLRVRLACPIRRQNTGQGVDGGGQEYMQHGN